MVESNFKINIGYISQYPNICRQHEKSRTLKRTKFNANQTNPNHLLNKIINILIYIRQGAKIFLIFDTHFLSLESTAEILMH